MRAQTTPRTTRQPPSSRSSQVRTIIPRARPAPEPGVSPDNVPPLPPPHSPVPDLAPPPVENPGDAPLPPITDPDVIEPGEPNPAHPADARARGSTASSSALEADEESRNVGSNLFSSSELEHPVMAANLSNVDGVTPGASVHDLIPQIRRNL
jgi:hypothetical protein